MIKLRRILHLFFLVMIVTAIVLLIVNIVDKTSFENDIRTVDEIFVILYYSSNIRLMF